MLDHRCAAAQHRVEGDDMLGARRHEERNHGSRADSQLMKGRCDAFDLIGKVGVAGAAAKKVKRWLRRVGSGSFLELINERAIRVLKVASNSWIVRRHPAIFKFSHGCSRLALSCCGGQFQIRGRYMPTAF